MFTRARVLCAYAYYQSYKFGTKLLGGETAREYDKNSVKKCAAIQKALAYYALFHGVRGVLRMLAALFYGKNDCRH